MSLLIRYTHIPFYFCFSFTSSTSLIHHYTLQPHMITLALAPLDRSHLFDGHMIYDSHVFTSIHSISNVRPPAVPPITSPCTAWSGTYYNFTSDEPYAHFLVFHSYLTCLYLPFAQNIIREEPHNCLYKFPPELRFSTYASHHLTLILHCCASHHTASQSHCLYSTPHLETIPCPQIAPP